MSPRDASSRASAPAHLARRRGRGAAVAAAAALLVVAPVTADASRVVPQGPMPQNNLAQPEGRPAISSADAVRWGALSAATETPASLPWMSAARLGSALPAAFGAAGSPAPAATGGGIPARVRDAYTNAEKSLAASQPGCRLPWWLLAGIGYVESGHAAGGNVDATGRTIGAIYGPVLDGSTPGTAVVNDSDGGAVDGDPHFDRAVGPMQFLPSTWRSFGTDANGDEQADPHNVRDAALSAGGYLCSGGGDLTNPEALKTAILRYNPSEEYVVNVLSAGQAYRDGRTPPPPWRPPTDPGVNTPPSDAPVGGVLPEAPETVVARPPAKRPTPAPSAPERTIRASGPTATKRPTPAPKPSTTAASPTPTTTSTKSPAPTSSPSPTSTPTPTRTSPTPTATDAPTAAPTSPTPLPVCEVPAPTSSPSPTSTTTPTPTSPAPTPSPNHTFGPDGRQTPIPTPTCVMPTASSSSPAAPASPSAAPTTATPTPAATKSAG